MRIAHRLAVVVLAIALLLVLLLVPRHGHGQSEQRFDDCIVRASALPTQQLLAATARQYGIERSPRRGLLNVSVEGLGDPPRTLNADVSAEVSDLTGHRQPIALRETSENGDIDYLGEFRLTGSGTYLFTVHVALPGRARPHVMKFSQEYVIE
jgi:hypothetical protein